MHQLHYMNPLHKMHMMQNQPRYMNLQNKMCKSLNLLG
jgi:hypothetical protein